MAERKEMIRWIILAKSLPRVSGEPDCRVGVVSPDAAPGRILAPRASGARKLSRCKEGELAPQERSACGGALFAVMVQILVSITRVAVQV